jgi:hypothetical protein
MRVDRASDAYCPIGPVLPAEMLASRKISLRLAVMADAEQSIPDIYREAAEEVRQLALRARLTDIRSDLLELSARFERLAAYADAAISLGVPGYPHGERLPVADDRSDRARAADRPLSSDSGPHTESASPNAESRSPPRFNRRVRSVSTRRAGPLQDA